jgi:hypothetical protein
VWLVPDLYIVTNQIDKQPGRKWEEWELPMYLCMYGGIVGLGIILYAKPDTSIYTWARDEALCRIKMRENGEEVS